MRIKIKGEVTEDRLAEALWAAAEKLDAVSPGHKVFGANLYLTTFDADGLPFKLVDHRGEPLMITIEAKSGELVRPSLTAEGEARRQERVKREQRRLDEERFEAETRRMRVEAEYEECRKKRAEVEEQFEAMNAMTAQLLKVVPDAFVGELNKVVQEVWDEFKPIETQVKEKGKLKALPVYSIHEGGLLLSVATWKSPRHLLNPLFTGLNYEMQLKSLWRHEAWAECENRICALMVDLGQSSFT